MYCFHHLLLIQNQLTMAKFLPVLLLVAVLANSIGAAAAQTIKCYEYAAADDKGGAVKPTAPCTATLKTDCIKTCPDQGKEKVPSNCHRFNTPKLSGGGCSIAGKTCNAVFAKMPPGDLWCRECSVALCNNAAGLAVGAVPLLVVAAMQQILA